MVLEHIDKGIGNINKEVELFDERYDLTRCVYRSKCINCGENITNVAYAYFVITNKGLLWWHQWHCHYQKPKVQVWKKPIPWWKKRKP